MGRTRQTANNNAGLAYLRVHADEALYRWISKALNEGRREEALAYVAGHFGTYARGGLNKVARIVGLLNKTPAEAARTGA